MGYSKKRFLAMLLLSSISLSTVSFADSISEMENKKHLNQKSADELKNSINSLEQEKNSLSGDVAVIDEEIKKLEAQISELMKQISALEIAIKETEEEIKKLEDNIDKNQKEFEERLGAMYKNSQVGYLDIVFSSSGIDDLLSKASTMKFITEYDKEIINNLKNDKLVIDAKKSELDGQKLSLEISKQTLDNKNAELYASKASKLVLIEEAANKQSISQAELEKLESEISTLEKSISAEKAAQAEDARKAREQAAQAKAQAQAKANTSNRQVASAVSTKSSVGAGEISTNVGNGTLGWPVPSSRNITSNYGYRTLFGVPEFHMGVDIAAPLGTAIASADSGTVIYSAYTGSYGNLMKVQHDSGIVTYYAHLSSYVASVGERVSKGQTIARMGSTGNSTGSHLHFEVRVNGAHTNPLNYIQ
ncbi:MAG: peptidoglycan DD-metalloendopeptidase family protein [Miniphocaeibacter sp.]|uniref:murein hydrolase activator EnvC family protein n=1 Tax=Miniphocaeibacter sp. TaxID=3100973 RepID=UPI0017DFDBC3|nr:peptidoglycan DD-metalloendopeptidase family protein [Gallicola sp.]